MEPNSRSRVTAETGGRRSAGIEGLGELGPPGDATTAWLSVRAVSRAIWVTVAFLILATFVVQLVRHRWGLSTPVILFDSDQKLNFPSAMKILLLLSATLLFAALALTVRDRWHRRRWFGISAVFALLSLDEMTYMHQRLSDALHDHLGTSGSLKFAWVLVYLPLLAALMVVYLPFWRKLSNPFRTQLLVAAIAFAGGSGGIEFVKAKLFDDDHWRLSFGMVASLSDSLELIGLALLVTALLTTLSRTTHAVTVGFNEGNRPT